MKSNLIENRQIRVFISSTFRDMQDERDELMKKTFPMLRRKAAERDVTLTELDLRWGITEEEAKTGKVVEICLHEIENSVPFFIGIIGNRYGWIPGKNDIGENVTDRFSNVKDYMDQGLSVTEMEMQFGVLNRKDEDLHAYFFIKEQEDDQIDEPQKLSELKQKVRDSQYPSTTYSSVEDLAQQVEQSFTALLDQLFPEGNISELEKERIGQRSFMHQLCQNYIRDEHNFQVIDDWVKNWNKKPMIISGASGIGKSAFIANWLKDNLKDENEGYRIIYYFIGQSGNIDNVDIISNYIREEINRIYCYSASSDEQAANSLQNLYSQIIRRKEEKLLIVIDGVNQLDESNKKEFVNVILRNSKRIKFLLTSQGNDYITSFFRKQYFNIYDLQPLTEGQCKEIITSYLSSYSKKLTGVQENKIAKDSQTKNALVLKTLLNNILSFGVYEKLDNKIDELTGTQSIADFYKAIIQSSENDFIVDGKNLVKLIMTILSVSRAGLTENEILDIAKIVNNNKGIGQLLWSQFYCIFMPLLQCRNGILNFSHEFIKEAANELFISSDESFSNECRNIILEYFKDNSFRSIEERRWQLYSLGRLDDLEKLMLDINVFIEYYNQRPTLLRYIWDFINSNRKDKAFERYYDLDCTDITTRYTFFISLSKFSYLYLSKYEFALKCAEKALKCCNGQNQAQIFDAKHNIAVQYLKDKRYAESIAEFENLLHYDNISKIDLSEIYYQIGIAYTQNNDLDGAKSYLEKSLAIRNELYNNNESEKAIIETQIRLANIYTKEKGRAAIDEYNKLLNICKNHNDFESSTYALLCESVGDYYYNIGDYKQSQERYETALDLYINNYGHNTNVVASIYFKLSETASKQKNYHQSHYWIKNATRIHEKIGNNIELSNDFLQVGKILDSLSQSASAYSYYEKSSKMGNREAANILESRRTPEEERIWLQKLGKKLSKDRALDYDQAMEYLHGVNRFSYTNNEYVSIAERFLKETIDNKKYSKLSHEVKLSLAKIYFNAKDKNYNIYRAIELLENISHISNKDIAAEALAILTNIYAIGYASIVKWKGTIEKLTLIDPKTGNYAKGKLYKFLKNEDEYKKYLNLSAEEGFEYAQFELGYISQDENLKINWFKKAAIQGNENAMNGLAHISKNHGDFESDLNWLGISSDLGNAWACNQLGLLYRNSKDYKLAIEYFGRAYNLNPHSYANDYAQMYAYGIGTEKDIDKALSIFLTGHLNICENDDWIMELGDCCNYDLYYVYGKNAQGDERIEWFEKASQGGNAKAMLELGYYFDKKDYSKALKYYKDAAIKGDAESQYCYASMLNNGDGIDENKQKAFKWLQKSANQNYDQSICCIAGMYYNGIGTNQDYNKAFSNYLISAQTNNNPESQEKVAFMYQNGIGINKDIDKAIFYYTNPARCGRKNAVCSIINLIYDVRARVSLCPPVLIKK